MQTPQKKVILVTGAGTGIGHDTVLHLLKEGYTVYGTVRNTQWVRALATAWAKVIPLDVTHEADVEKAITKIIQESWRIDVLINNAGYALYGSVEEVPLKEARYQFDVNLFAIAKLTQCVIPHMRNSWAGKIINISSVWGKIAFPLGAWYHASKHALEWWSDSLRGELRDMNIQVVLVEPWIIWTWLGKKMCQNLEVLSSQWLYKGIAKNMSDGISFLYFPQNSSPVWVVSSTISKIITHKNPRTRYKVWKYSYIFIWMRYILGDKWFEGLFLGTWKWERNIRRFFGIKK